MEDVQSPTIDAVKDVIRNNWQIFYVNFIEKMMTYDGMESYPDMSYKTAMSYSEAKVADACNKVPIIPE